MRATCTGALLVLWALGACHLHSDDDGSYEELSMLGGTCAESADCELGLVCVSQECLHDEATVVAAYATDFWTDRTTGLTWQREPLGSGGSWDGATNICGLLGLPGGGWRLPTISELRTLIRWCPDSMTGGACKVTDG